MSLQRRTASGRSRATARRKSPSQTYWRTASRRRSASADRRRNRRDLNPRGLAPCHLSPRQSGGDVPMFELVKRLNYRIVDKMVRDLRRIYKENPNLFDVPTFAQKQY